MPLVLDNYRCASGSEDRFQHRSRRIKRAIPAIWWHKLLLDGARGQTLLKIQRLVRGYGHAIQSKRYGLSFNCCNLGSGNMGSAMIHQGSAIWNRRGAGRAMDNVYLQ
jgi:hypothetical protein